MQRNFKCAADFKEIDVAFLIALYQHFGQEAFTALVDNIFVPAGLDKCHAFVVVAFAFAVDCSGLHVQIPVCVKNRAYESNGIKGCVLESDIDFFEVGGAFEIPLHAKLLAKTGRYAGIVGAALVVDGGIYRHDFVAQTVVSALMQVQLETEVPVFSVSLTPHHFHAGEEHQKFFFDHFEHKGQEAAKTCADTLQKIRTIKRMDSQQKRAV